jgi:hypothetical protein
LLFTPLPLELNDNLQAIGDVYATRSTLRSMPQLHHEDSKSRHPDFSEAISVHDLIRK